MQSGTPEIDEEKEPETGVQETETWSRGGTKRSTWVNPNDPAAPGIEPGVHEAEPVPPDPDTVVSVEDPETGDTTAVPI